MVAKTELRGRTALDQLGTRVAAVAKANNISERQLCDTLARDQSAWIDATSRLYFTEPARPASPPGTVMGVTVPDSTDAFLLHSYPTATRKIFLDFNGNTSTVAGWNSGAPIVSAPWDMDGLPGTFNATEKAFIAGVWRGVAEDFAPWQVDVTTQDPGIESLRKTSATDAEYGIRVVISPTNWKGLNFSGVSWNNSFNWNSDTPNYVFSKQTGNDMKFMGDIVSHEVGHTVGLLHDGKGTNPYYEGANGWAPIMGNPGYQGLTQWSKGEYGVATNTQDDVATIDAFIPRRPDETGAGTIDAKAVAAPASFDGVLAARTDVDSYKVTLKSGKWLFSAAPTPNYVPDTNLSLAVYNAAGTSIASSNPAGLAAPTISLTVPAGTYYVRVDGVGEGDPLTTGYSDYGSLGYYRMTIKATI